MTSLLKLILWYDKGGGSIIEPSRGYAFLSTDYLSKPFKISMGLRQRCVLSPILFNLFVNDLPAFIAVVQEGVQFGESSLSCLLYADPS